MDGLTPQQLQALIALARSTTGTATASSNISQDRDQPATSNHETLSLAEPPPSQITSYNSIRTRQLLAQSGSQGIGHPSSNLTAASATGRPLLGIPAFGFTAGLGSCQSQRNANHARLQHNSLPPSPGANSRLSLPRATHPQLPQRPRGAARQSPRLPSHARPTVESCLSTSPEGEVVLNIRTKVYPPREPGSDDQLCVYVNHRDSVDAELNRLLLVHNFEMSLQDGLPQLLNLVSQEMQGCSLNYEFVPDPPSTSQTGLAFGEGQCLGLLRLLNRGTSGRDGCVHLVETALSTTASMTLGQLAGNKQSYGMPVCIQDGRLIIHLIVLEHPVAYHAATTGGQVVRHTCLSNKFYSKFPSDAPDRVRDAHRRIQPGCDCVQDDQDSSSDFEDGGIMPRGAVSLPPLRPPVTRSQTQAQLVPQLDDRLDSGIPSELFKVQFRPKPGIPGLRLGVVSYPIEIFDSAGEQDRQLVVQGANMASLIEVYYDTILQSVAAGDYSQLLAPQREFQIVNPATGDMQSAGEGIEREVIWGVWQTYFQANAGVYFAPKAGNYASPSTTLPIASHHLIASSRLRQVEAQGVVTALLLITGIMPQPIGPGFLQWVVHDCDLHSLSMGFLAEWYPELRHTLMSFGELSPFSPITAPEHVAHFATYHDIQAATLQNRDAESHKALQASMLYLATIAREPPYHNELQAFIRGFSLKCPNGFDFRKALRSFTGGSNVFFSVIGTSIITSYTSISRTLKFEPPAADIADSLSRVLGSTWPSLEALFEDFLTTIGVPFNPLWEDAKLHFSPKIDLADIDSPAFRPRALFWAATGTPFVDVTGDKLAVAVTNSADAMYHPNRRMAAGYARNGKLSFRTCLRHVRLPIEHLLHLAGQDYSAPDAPPSLRVAVHHWLLCELLTTIGGVTMA